MCVNFISNTCREGSFSHSIATPDGNKGRVITLLVIAAILLIATILVICLLNAKQPSLPENPQPAQIGSAQTSWYMGSGAQPLSEGCYFVRPYTPPLLGTDELLFGNPFGWQC